MATLTDCAGQLFTGKIKSYSSSKGYGFVITEDLDQDIFFVHKNLSKEVAIQAAHRASLENAEVEFTLDISEEGKPLATSIKVTSKIGKGKSKGKGQATEGTWGQEDSEVYVAGKGSMELNRAGSWKPGKKVKEEEQGEQLLEGQRVEGRMKSYNFESKWGFANLESGEFGDVFVHMNNLQEDQCLEELGMRIGDIVEMSLEQVWDKVIARDVVLVPQEGLTFEGLWMRGKITKFADKICSGAITTPRVVGDIRFVKTDLPWSLQNRTKEENIGTEVLFRVSRGVSQNCVAKMVNPIEPLDDKECQTRVDEMVRLMSEEGVLDELAQKKLGMIRPEELLAVLGDLDLINSENPSSYILGSLSRSRKREKGEPWKGSGKGPSFGGYGKWQQGNWGHGKAKGKGKGKGKGKRAVPYW